MLTLTTPVTVRNITRMKIVRVMPDVDTNIAYVHVDVIGPGNAIYGDRRVLQVRNSSDGMSQGIRATVSPAGFEDVVEVFQFAWTTGFTELSTLAGATLAAKYRNAETLMTTAGGFPPGTVS